MNNQSPFHLCMAFRKRDHPSLDSARQVGCPIQWWPKLPLPLWRCVTEALLSVVFFCLSCWIFYNFSSLFWPNSLSPWHWCNRDKEVEPPSPSCKVVQIFSLFIFIFSVVFSWKAFMQDISPTGKHSTAPLTGQEGLNSCAQLRVNYLSASLSSPPSSSAASFFPWFVSTTREQAENPDFREDNGRFTVCPQWGHIFHLLNFRILPSKDWN